MEKKYINETNDNLFKTINEDILPGGQADNRPDADFDSKELASGVKHELEHISVDDYAEEKGLSSEEAKKEVMAMAKEIAKDHLVENPKYYSDLDAFEKKGN